MNKIEQLILNEKVVIKQLIKQYLDTPDTSIQEKLMLSGVIKVHKSELTKFVKISKSPKQVIQIGVLSI